MTDVIHSCRRLRSHRPMDLRAPPGTRSAPLPACFLVALAAVAPLPAGAVDDAPAPPRFTFAQAPAAGGVQWKGKAQAGLAASAGNSRALSVSASASLSRKAGDDQVSADAAAAFARSRVQVATEQDGVPGIGPGELRSVDQTMTQAWSARVRYDRFFARRNSGYASAHVAGDRPAGKALLVGGQLGYRRLLYDGPKRQLSVEAGYDLTHLEYVASGSGIDIHSGRLFVGWRSEPDPVLGFEASAEALSNLTPEMTPTGRVPALQDLRIAGLLAASVKVADRGSIGLRLIAQYDAAPAPRPPPPGVTFEPGFVPLADSLDTRAEAALVWQFL